MNIFALHSDPKLAAQYHCDRHSIKMLLELGQILSTTHRVLDNLPPEDDRFYKATHQNHPSCIWARSTKDNYSWLIELFSELCSEYTHRYSRVHKTSERFQHFKYHPINIPPGELQPFAMAMPEAYRSEDPVESYRTYYLNDKTYMATWTGRECPQWFREGLNKKSGIAISQSINRRGQTVQRPQLT